MEATWRWSVRVFAFLAMLFFAALMVVFVIVTVQHFGEKEYVNTGLIECRKRETGPNPGAKA